MFSIVYLFLFLNFIIYFILGAIHLCILYGQWESVYSVHEAVLYQTMSSYYGARHNVGEAHVLCSLKIFSIQRGNKQRVIKNSIFEKEKLILKHLIRLDVILLKIVSLIPVTLVL
jgi:hypothetical protein